MPIGKNAIKRVTNNGCSNVKSSAPDMENSVVAEEKKSIAKKKSTMVETTKTQKKPSVAKPASAPQKSMEAEPELSPGKTLEKIVEGAKREGDGYINLGGKLPYYLL